MPYCHIARPYCHARPYCKAILQGHAGIRPPGGIPFKAVRVTLKKRVDQGGGFSPFCEVFEASRSTFSPPATLRVGHSYTNNGRAPGHRPRIAATPAVPKHEPRTARWAKLDGKAVDGGHGWTRKWCIPIGKSKTALAAATRHERGNRQPAAQCTHTQLRGGHLAPKSEVSQGTAAR